ncbi:Vitamin B12 import ATP-binding protein BtuD [Candidatus Hepatincola sp. Pdp]
MPQSIVSIQNLSLSFPDKICFKNFTYIVNHRDKIGIIGNNGTGKSSLLKLINNFQEYEVNQQVEGKIVVLNKASIGYIPQFIPADNELHLSGGERFSQLFFQQIRYNPNLLLLDEPTNHLDINNRTHLIKCLKNFKNTLIVVSHNVELLSNCVNILWHIQDNTIHTFKGKYNHYMNSLNSRHTAIQKELLALTKQQKKQHNNLMQQEQLVAKRKQKGLKKIANKRIMPSVAHTLINNAEKSQGNRLKDINSKKQLLLNQLSQLNVPEIIKPKFHFYSLSKPSNKFLLSIHDGNVGYKNNSPILKNINLNLSYGDRIAITGNNGSGKSTLVKGILGDPHVIRTGVFSTPNKVDIGYLDQHYELLNSQETILESLEKIMPSWTQNDIRLHLHDFLFKSNECVNKLIKHLSQGEKVRLALCHIGAKTPNLLILDELSNNLDMETKNHVISVLYSYKGSILIIDHDEQFLNNLGVTSYYHL